MSVSVRLMRVRCNIQVSKCAGNLSDGRSSGVKFKLPLSLVASAGWSLVRGRLYGVNEKNGRKKRVVVHEGGRS